MSKGEQLTLETSNAILESIRILSAEAQKQPCGLNLAVTMAVTAIANSQINIIRLLMEDRNVRNQR